MMRCRGIEDNEKKKNIYKRGETTRVYLPAAGRFDAGGYNFGLQL